MHIAVTTRFLLPGGHLEGLGRYTFETLRCLVQQQPDCTFHFLFDRAYDPRYLLGPNVVPHVLLPPARHPLLMLAWYEGAVAWWLRRHRPAALQHHVRAHQRRQAHGGVGKRGHQQQAGSKG